MKFRPCIDIHRGKVKQIVGSTLTDAGVTANFESALDSAHYARLFDDHNLPGGHIIQLDQSDSTISAAKLACETFPNGMQVGGGIQLSNARCYLERGASHVIVTSFIFPDGSISMERLQMLVDEVGKRSIVVDLSCAPDEVGSVLFLTLFFCVNSLLISLLTLLPPSLIFFCQTQQFRVMMNRWQTSTNFTVNSSSLLDLSGFCDEFLVHSTTSDGTCSGLLSPT
jgi:phosphoribosylformimino-5-aminoimidazole carboxamide ribotide isomerase